MSYSSVFESVSSQIDLFALSSMVSSFFTSIIPVWSENKQSVYEESNELLWKTFFEENNYPFQIEEDEENDNVDTEKSISCFPYSDFPSFNNARDQSEKESDCTENLPKGSIPEIESNPSLRILPYSDDHYDDKVLQMINLVIGGLEKQIVPERISDATSGVYFFFDDHANPCAVFKPANEEVGCESNPKGNFVASRAHIGPGESMIREVAAYLLDRDHFVGVPPTCTAICSSQVFSGPEKKKIGSLQKFVDYHYSSEDRHHSFYSVLDVQKIAMFDMRILNLDRHEGNILVCEESSGKYGLIPIDHGLCFPSYIEVQEYEWCWLNWEQLKKPIHPEVVAHINSFNVDDDISILSGLGINLPFYSLLALKIMTLVLQMCCKAGMSLYQIATMIVRRNEKTPSALEKMIVKSKWQVISKNISKKSEIASKDLDSQFMECLKGNMNCFLNFRL
eukprot:c36732_g1_i1.p1 GENE.c36732_g1_i1~~c36732_g1_i1.p1  ORF type:complete len:451 (-),score=158.07 c36732_g1_i1:38-1390(-)